jgi:hypothetical protein
MSEKPSLPKENQEAKMPAVLSEAPGSPWLRDQECRWTPVEGKPGTHRCVQCGRVVNTDDPDRKRSFCISFLPKMAPNTMGEKKRFPSAAQMVWNLAKSLASFVADGCKLVSVEQYEARMKMCDGCGFRVGNRCKDCGCFLSWKAMGRVEVCLEGNWPKV